jgi:hypothetical protein
VRFFSFLEGILRPEARNTNEQMALATRLDGILALDGYEVRPTGYTSGRAIYSIVRRLTGVAGSFKNLIFASIGAKPDLVFRDAVNNDVEIASNAEACLIHERPIDGSKGLSWFDLGDWWQRRNNIPDAEQSRKALGDRLRQALPKNSPGEITIFRVYFEEYRNRLAEKLPALLPQVYLHYDPLN